MGRRRDSWGDRDAYQNTINYKCEDFFTATGLAFMPSAWYQYEHNIDNIITITS